MDILSAEPTNNLKPCGGMLIRDTLWTPEAVHENTRRPQGFNTYVDNHRAMCRRLTGLCNVARFPC